MSQSPHLPPLAAYQQAINKGFVDDPAQRLAVNQLQRCYEQLHQPATAAVRGVYLWGPVGRGKTWLMDCFQNSLSVPVRRSHFHHFMRWVHQRLFQFSGRPDPLQLVVDELARDLKVLCLDELIIQDISDAMILGRLIQLIFSRQLVLVLTSNNPPQELYADGHHRDRLQPAITAIMQQMDVVDVCGSQDHRLHPGVPTQRYWLHEDQQQSRMTTLFNQLNQQPADTRPLLVNRRSIETVCHSETVLWCTYAQLCEASLWYTDYIELCDRFQHILLSEVDSLADETSPATIARGTEDAVERVETGDRELPQLTKRDNSVRRFIALVDECYDRRVPLYLEARVPMEQLYPHGYLEFSFRRTLSRLREMQLARFGE